jgi:hypothetical protein
MTADVVASISKEKILWDERNEDSPWNFGLYRMSFNTGADGQIEGAVTVYPVSTVKLFAAAGGSYRYYKLPTFNCDTVNCAGFLQRLRLGFSFVMVFGEDKNWILNPTYENINLSTGETKQSIADESENVLAAPSGDTFDAVTIVAGKKVGISLYGLYARQGRFRLSSQYNELQAALVRTDWRETSFILGLGRYASSFYVPGITFFLSYEWRWGKSQSLF